MKRLNRTLVELIFITATIGVGFYYVPKLFRYLTEPIYNIWANSQPSCKAGITGLWCSTPYFTLLSVISLLVALLGYIIIYRYLNKKVKHQEAIIISVIGAILFHILGPFIPKDLIYSILLLPLLYTLTYILVLGGKKK